MARCVCRMRILHVMLVLVLGGMLGGCGPIVYVSEVTYHASDAVDAAKAAHADKYAPYWWTRATQYLAKAREIAAYADFQGANRFGRLATEAANKAKEEAMIAEQDPSKRPLDEHPAIAPAKEPGGTGSEVRPPRSMTRGLPGSEAGPPSSTTRGGPRAVPAKEPASRVAPAKDAP